MVASSGIGLRLRIEHLDIELGVPNRPNWQRIHG